MSARKPIAQHKPIPERTGTFILIRFAKCEWVMKPYTDWFREDGKKWWNRGGGYQPATKDPAVTILRRVENATWKTLDRAPIVTPDDPLPELNPKSRAGWLAPDGGTGAHSQCTRQLRRGSWAAPDSSWNRPSVTSMPPVMKVMNIGRFLPDAEALHAPSSNGWMNTATVYSEMTGKCWMPEVPRDRRVAKKHGTQRSRLLGSSD